MLLRIQFWERYEQLHKNMSLVLEVSESLRNSESFRELLSLILLVGNFMNASSLQGGAFGMRISSINKLADTKASNVSSLTLLHVLAGVTRRQFPHLLEFLHDLKDTGQAARIMVSINDLVQQYTDMRQGLKQLDLELGTQWQPEDVTLEEGDCFRDVMTEFRDEASNKFEDLQTVYVNMDAKWKDVMVYYGENPKVMRPDDFFGVFARFVSSWKDAAIAEEKHTLKLEREEKRRKEEELRKQRLEAKRQRLAEKEAAEKERRIEDIDLSEEATGTEDDRKMMDNLLAKLRSADAEPSVPRTRRRRQRSEEEEQVRDDDVQLAENLLKSLQSD